MFLQIIKIVILFTLTVISLDVSFALSVVSSPMKTKTNYLQMKINTSTDDDGNDDNSKKTKRIAIIGAGAVGSYYGGRIWESVRTRQDTSVMFHLRGEHYDYCTKNGIDVSSYHGDFSIPPEELLAYRSTEDMAKSVDDGGIFDWVICSLKSTSVSAVNMCMFRCNFVYDLECLRFASSLLNAYFNFGEIHDYLTLAGSSSNSDWTSAFT